MTADFSALRILVVDDQSHVRTFVRGVLAGLGIEQVVEAANGRAALEVLREPGRQFDLALVDLKMTDLDGVETIREMARLHARCAVAILSVEDSHVLDSAGSLAQLLGLRFLGAIQKPLTDRKLLPVLQRVVERTRAASATPPGIAPVEVRDALAAGQFQLVYDPQINIRSGECEGATAVLRWMHPQRGEIGWPEFRPAVDRTPDYARMLADEALKQGMTASARWGAGGHPVGVAVPVSARAFDRLDFADRLEAMANALGASPAAVTLVLPVHGMPEHTVALIDVTTRLRLKGFGLAISEFGSGKTALDFIDQIPFREMHLDSGIVNGCASDEKKRAMVEASLALAKRLRLRSVAEGVANRDEWNLLADLGCDAAQGPFLARPADADELTVWVTRWMMTVSQMR
jgi:EAL domain-containing protein (putative c-di-GMP-specific phosphodiesterase class I)/CheY-like chemotaxis protein